MTTLTNNLNEKLFTQLASAEAEVIQGGVNWKFRGYDGYGGKGGVLASANYRIPKLKYPNRISSIRINGGVWGLYDKPDFHGLLGKTLFMGKGLYSFRGSLSALNNRAESVQNVDA